VQRQERADLEDLQARVGTEDVMDDEDPVAVERTDANGLVRAPGQRFRVGERPRAELAQVKVAIRELEELSAHSRLDSAWLSETDFRRLLPVCCPAGRTPLRFTKKRPYC
jgi:hypothetical protein